MGVKKEGNIHNQSIFDIKVGLAESEIMEEIEREKTSSEISYLANNSRLKSVNSW